MAGVNITDNGLSFLISIEMGKAIGDIDKFKNATSTMAQSVEASFKSMSGNMDSLSTSIINLSKILESSTGVTNILGIGVNGLGNYKAVNEELTKLRNRIQELSNEIEGLKSATLGAGSATKDLEESLTKITSMGAAFKALGGTIAAALSFDSLKDKANEISTLMFQLENRSTGLEQRNGKGNVIGTRNVTSETMEVAKGSSISTTEAAANMAIARNFGIQDFSMQKRIVEKGADIGHYTGNSTAYGTEFLSSMSQQGFDPDRVADVAAEALYGKTKAKGSIDQVLSGLNVTKDLEERLVTNDINRGVDKDKAMDASLQRRTQATYMVNELVAEGRTDRGTAEGLVRTMTGFNLDKNDPERAKRISYLMRAGGSSNAEAEAALQSQQAGDSAPLAGLIGKAQSNVGELNDAVIANLTGGMSQAHLAAIGAVGDKLGAAAEAGREAFDSAKTKPGASDRETAKWEATFTGSINELTQSIARLHDIAATLASGPMQKVIEAFTILTGVLEKILKPIATFLADKNDPSAVAAQKGIAAAGGAALIGYGVRKIESFSSKVAEKLAPFAPADPAALSTNSASVANRSLGKVAKVLGKPGVLTAALGAMDVYDAYSKEGEVGENTRKAVVTTGAAATGAWAGAKILGNIVTKALPKYEPLARLAGMVLGAGIASWGAEEIGPVATAGSLAAVAYGAHKISQANAAAAAAATGAEAAVESTEDIIAARTPTPTAESATRVPPTTGPATGVPPTAESATRGSKAIKAAKSFGKSGLITAAVGAVDIYDSYNEEGEFGGNTKKAIASTVGSSLGAWGGAELGAMAGMALAGPVGAAVGSVVGLVAGGIAGELIVGSMVPSSTDASVESAKTARVPPTAESATRVPPTTGPANSNASSSSSLPTEAVAPLAKKSAEKDKTLEGVSQSHKAINTSNQSISANIEKALADYELSIRNISKFFTEIDHGFTDLLDKTLIVIESINYKLDKLLANPIAGGIKPEDDLLSSNGEKTIDSTTNGIATGFETELATSKKYIKQKASFTIDRSVLDMAFTPTTPTYEERTQPKQTQVVPNQVDLTAVLKALLDINTSITTGQMIAAHSTVAGNSTPSGNRLNIG